jgi:hypothetical protein
MEAFLQNAREGKYTEALAWMKIDKNKAELLKVIRADLVDDDDDDAFWDYLGIYDLAMDTATDTDAADAGEFATLLKAFIIEACAPDHDLTNHHLFTGYPVRQGKRKTAQYYKYLSETNYLRANEFIRIPGNREAVVRILHDEFEKGGLDMIWQNLYDAILADNANDTAELLQRVIKDATNEAIILDPQSVARRRAARIAANLDRNMQRQAAEEAADAANAAAAGANNNGYESEMHTLPPPPHRNNNNMGGGRRRKTRRRARKTTRRIRKSTRRGGGKKYARK